MAGKNGNGAIKISTGENKTSAKQKSMRNSPLSSNVNKDGRTPKKVGVLTRQAKLDNDKRLSLSAGRSTITNFFRTNNREQQRAVSVDRAKVDKQYSPSVNKRMSKETGDPVDKRDKSLLEAMKHILNTRLDEISEKIDVSKEENKLQLQNLQSSINAKFNEHEDRITSVEEKIVELQSTVAISNDLSTRVVALESSGSTGVNSHVANWLSKVSNSVEAREKAEKRLNIIIKGLDFPDNNHLDTVEKFLLDKFELRDVIQEISTWGNEQSLICRVKLKDWETKKIILEQKSSRLRNSEIYVEKDLTVLEREVAWKVRARATEEEALGKKVRRQTDKLQIGKTWFVWDQISGKFMEEMHVAGRNLAPRSSVSNSKNKNKKKQGSQIRESGRN